ncbi:MAG TPA: glycosyltransferase [Ktedonobacteraceae bacterium]|jgi:trehalose synthase
MSIKSTRLDQYRQLVGDDILTRIYRAAEPLAGVRVLHLNTTAQGGRVAELLHSLLPLMEELDIPHTWQVVQLDSTSNLFAAHLADLLQGLDHKDIPDVDQHIFLERLARSRKVQQTAGSPMDLYFIHDFQLVPLATLFPWMRPALWMCHVDTANPDPVGKAYVAPFLDAYNVCVFDTSSSLFHDLPEQQTRVITPSIDPFSEKNRYLSPEAGLQMLRLLGIDTTRPLITQVARFGNWKNSWQVIDVYRLVKQKLPDVQVALIGAMEASDDIKATKILEDVQQRAADDPDIHLFSDPAVIDHPRVNAFQRYSSVILQRSTREGSGLTVTEAMWKYQPVVGTSATELRTRIIDGHNGSIADSIEECAQRTLQFLRERALWRVMGERANAHVRQRYLFPTMVLQYLEALTRARGRLQH